jgi:hypothetical protein
MAIIMSGYLKVQAHISGKWVECNERRSCTSTLGIAPFHIEKSRTFVPRLYETHANDSKFKAKLHNYSLGFDSVINRSFRILIL